MIKHQLRPVLNRQRATFSVIGEEILGRIIRIKLGVTPKCKRLDRGLNTNMIGDDLIK